MIEVFNRNVASSFNIYNVLIKWYSKVVLKYSPPDALHAYRNIERNTVKLIKSRAHRSFNETCVNNNLLPNYTNVKLYDDAARRKEFFKNFRNDLIQNEILTLDSEIDDLESLIDNNHEELKTRVSNFKFQSYKYFLNNVILRMKDKIEMDQQRKLCRLYGGHIRVKQHETVF